jgi:hypothetical protein
MTVHGMLRDESGRRTMETAGCMGKHYAWTRGRGMREGAWWTAEQGQPCCGCKASNVHQAWGTWGMRVRQAELGLVLRARGMRARGHALCTSMAGHQGPKEQEHSGHCWVHQHRKMAWALGRGARGQLRWTSGARMTVMLWMQSQRRTLGMARVRNEYEASRAGIGAGHARHESTRVRAVK